ILVSPTGRARRACGARARRPARPRRSAPRECRRRRWCAAPRSRRSAFRRVPAGRAWRFLPRSEGSRVELSTGGEVMHVGMGIIFQGQGEAPPDRNVYRNELRLGDLAEPLGFDSLWGVEHHFTDYTMCPDVLQYLTYFAGRTTRIQLGSMVVVLPWHEPLRVAEQVIV